MGIIESIIIGIGSWCLFLFGGVTWLLWHHRDRPEPSEPNVTSGQLALLKAIAKPPPPPKRLRWYHSRNEKLLMSVSNSYSEIIRTATDHYQLSPKERIALARQAYAQDAITIDELERVIEHAIKEEA